MKSAGERSRFLVELSLQEGEDQRRRHGTSEISHRGKKIGKVLSRPGLPCRPASLRFTHSTALRARFRLGP